MLDSVFQERLQNQPSDFYGQAWIDIVVAMQQANLAYFQNLSSSVLDGPSLSDYPYSSYPEPIFIPYSGSTSITGIQNVISKYGNLPRVYGTYKMRPPLAAQFVNVVEGGETYAMGLFCLGYGPLDISEVKIGDKDIATIAGCTYQILPGVNPSTEVITIFNPDFTDLSVNQALTYNVAANATAPQAGVQLQIDISFPNGLASFDSSGARSATTVQVKAEYSLDGVSWTNIGPDSGLESDPCFTVTDNSLSVVRRTRIITLPAGTYKVRLTRLTEASTSSSLVNACTWTLLRAFGETPSVLPHKDSTGATLPLAFIALKIKASDTVNGQLDDLNCIVKSKLNTWNGAEWTTTPVVTNNPAWIFADILSGTCNRRPKPKSSLDGPGLKAWADFCDAQGFTFNDILEGGDTVNAVLRNVAIAGRASIFNNDGAYGVVIDQPQTNIVQHFTSRNTHSLEVEQLFPDTPHSLKLRFNNAASDYLADERVVYDDGYNADGTNGMLLATEAEGTQLVGVTSADHAWKLGRYYLAQGRLRRRTVSFATDIEHMVCQRFDLIRLTSDIAKFGLGQGYIKSLTLDGSDNITAITLDETVDMVAGSQYCVRIRCADMSSQKHTVATVAGSTASLTFATPIAFDASVKPAVGDLVMFGTLDNESREMIITGIEHQEDKSAKIICIDHAPACYAAASGTIPAFTSGISVQEVQQQAVAVPVLLSSRADEQVLHRDTDGSLQSRIQLVLQAPPANVQFVQVQMKLSDAANYGTAQVFPAGSGQIFLGPVIDRKTYDIEVRNVSYQSRRSLPLAIPGIYVVGKTTAPPNVPYLDRLGTNNNILIWAYNETTLGEPVPMDFAGIRLKWNYGANPNWDSGNIGADLITGSQFDMTVLPKGPLTIMVKAVDTTGNESESATLLLKDFGDQITSNVILQTDHHPLWTLGTATNGTVIDNELCATDDGTLFWGSDNNALFWNADNSAAFWSNNYDELTYEWSITIDPSLYPVGTQAPELIMEVEQESEQFSLDYRNAGGSLFWGIAPGADALPFWGADGADTFWDAPSPFVPFPGRIVVGIETYTFRAICSASRSVPGKLITLSEILDVPDVIEYIDDAAILSTGTRLPITKTYRGVRNVQLSWQQQAGDVGSYPFLPSAVDKSASGPLIEVFDRTGATVNATIDAIVQGY